MVVHAYNLCYFGDGDKKLIVRDQPKQGLVRPRHKNKPGGAVHTCGPSYLENRGRRISVQGQPGKS
jgi:hypothetical protein